MTRPGYLTIGEAADRLGVKPWDVVRLIENGDLYSVELVEADSVDTYQEQQK